jgi:hypothetical protein
VATDEEEPRRATDFWASALARRSAISAADSKAASPTFERSSAIRFFASSLSREPGCCRITSL